MDDLWFTLRVINYFLYGGILTGTMAKFHYLRITDWPAFRWGFWMFVAASAYAAGEVMFLQLPGGPRLVLFTISLTVLCAGCWWNPVKRLVLRTKEKRDGC